jgi:hypothetical protein
MESSQPMSLMAKAWCATTWLWITITWEWWW